MHTTFRIMMILIVACMCVTSMTGCKRCEGEQKKCPDSDEQIPTGKCFFETKYCEGCPTITQYKGHYNECVDEYGMISTECKPECYIQKCTKYVFVPKVPCEDRTSLEECDKECKYELAKTAIVPCGN